MESDLMVENRYTTAMINHAAIEPHAYLAQVDPDGSITVWSTNQAPHMAVDAISQALGVPAHRIRVITPYIGGGFGGKLEIRGEPICAALAMKTNRPVKLIYTRQEVFAHTTVRHPFIIYVKDGVKKDGKILARQVRYILNSGAYAGSGHWVPKYAAFSAINSYSIPNVKIDAYSVYTNQAVGGAFRGFGCSQSLWALETQMDAIAHQLGMDPVELRVINLLKEGDYSAAGEKMQAVGSAECLEKAARELYGAEEGRKKGAGEWVRGRGLALATIMSVAPTVATVHLRVFDDGFLEVRSGAVEHGQGAHTVLSQIAAEEFGMPVEKVRVMPVDTLLSPVDMGAISSRQTFNSGNALRLACRDAKRQLFEKAAQKMEASPDDMETRGGKIFVRGAPSKAIEIKDIFSPMFMAGRFYRDGGELMGKAVWTQPADRTDKESGRLIPGGRVERISAFHMPAVQAVEVEVNINSGQVRVVKFIGVNDVGKAINPTMVEGQINGGMGMGIGSTLFEEMVYEKGAIVNSSFTDYKLPTAMDMPACDETRSVIVEVPMDSGPYGAKGVGEAVMVAVAPAIGNAIYDAVGVRLTELPITPEKVLKALREVGRAGR
jgi:CO/xanthine dehydrogenase Mo-binding subunit